MSAHPAEAFRAKHPDRFYLERSEARALQDYLRSRSLLAEGEIMEEVRQPGEGNMNCTLRVRTSRRSFIVKQSRPWVEKYPALAAPADRILMEAAFYRLLSEHSKLKLAVPGILDFDAVSRLLVLEDLGEGGDYTDLYRGASITSADLENAADFLTCLHASFSGESLAASIRNSEMRALNHAHIFDIPLNQDNGLDLDRMTTGLDEVARDLRGDPAYAQEVRRLGREAYLGEGICLIHGDFFPGSLVRTPRGPRVIDPEFCFFGRPEFDAGVFLAHLVLAGRPESDWHHWKASYHPPEGFDRGMMWQLAGVEIMRRLIGYAQLPLRIGLNSKRDWLELSRSMVLNPGSFS